MASSWTSASWSPDDLLDEPSRDRAPRTSAVDGGDDDDVSALPERVISRLRNQGTLEKICRKYSIPDGFAPILAGGFSSWSPPPPGSVCVYLESLDAGMRLPLHPFFSTVLNHFGLAPSQLAPNGWRVLAGFVVLSHLAGVEPSLAVFRHFFALCLLPPHRFYSFRGKDTAGLLFGRIRSHIRGWKEEFFFLESSAPWPCPAEWGEPSRSSTMDPPLTVEEKAVAENLLCARGSSPIDLSTYLHNRNMAAAKIIGAPSRPPTPQGAPVYLAMEDIQAEKAVSAAAARASAWKVTVKSEPDCKVPPCALSLGKKRKLEEDRSVDGESWASDPSCPPGFSTPWKPPSATSNDGEERQCALQQHRDRDWKAARRLLQGTVTPSRGRELAASKPADVVASSYVSLLQAANEVAFSLGHALELEEKLRAREREADALREELGRKTKALERDGAVADALRAELRKAKTKLAETKADAERAAAERERRGYERGLEDMKRAALRRYPKLDPARLVVPLHGPP